MTEASAAKKRKLPTIGGLIDMLYRKTGTRGIAVLIYLLSLTVHIVFAMQMELLSVDPNEFSAAAYAALFTGKDWSGVMSQISYYYGYAGAIFYSPAMLFTSDPLVQYRMMLIINGILVSFVPLLTFGIAPKLGVKKAWQATVIAICCGFYTTYVSHTKFIWNETLCILLPWLIIWLVIKASDSKRTFGRAAYSLAAAFCCVLSFAADNRMIGVVLAVIVTLLFSRFAMGKRYVSLPSFFISLIGFAVLERLACFAIRGFFWGDSQIVLRNSIEYRILNFASLSESGSLLRFVQTAFGHLYYFVTSTWGLGGLFIALTFIMVASFLHRKRRMLEQQFKPALVIFAIYAFLALFNSGLISVLCKFGEETLTKWQDTVIFGRYSDNVIPLALMLVLAYIFCHELDFTKLLGGVISLGVIYAGFFIFTAPVILSATSIRISPILGICPTRIGEPINSIIDLNLLMLTASSVFSIMAMFIVVVCCAKKYRSHILSFIITGFLLYSGIYTAVVYLPMCAEETAARNAPVAEITEHLYNQEDAPPIAAYKTTRSTASLLQYYNQKATVLFATEKSQIPDSCFIVALNSMPLSFVSTESFVLEKLYVSKEYTVYAYGERAVAYVQSQLNTDEDLREDSDAEIR